MKQITRIVGSIALLATSAAVQAGPLEDLFGSGQAQMQKQFENLSDDFATVFSYKAASPASSLAGGIIPFGFDLAFETSLTSLNDGSILKDAMPGDFSYVPFPKGHLTVGVAIPFIPFVPAIDVGVEYMKLGEAFSHIGGELKVNIAGGNIVLPAVAVRGVFSNTSFADGSKDVMSMGTYGAELAVSKGFGIGIKITPYAGVGYHMFSASSDLTYLDLASGTDIPAAVLTELSALNGKLLKDYSGGMGKWFIGANLKLLAFNLGYEMDSTGGNTTQTAKIGFVF